MTEQPKWALVAQLGDVNPVDYGGYFIYEDATGVYPPEAEYLDAPDNDDGQWIAYRFSLDKCTLTGDVLSDNPYHPDMPAWFAKLESGKASRPQDTTYLSGVADCCGVAVADLRQWFCSESTVDRANAYRLIGEYHGFDNLDSYPLTFNNRAEVESRYSK